MNKSITMPNNTTMIIRTFIDEDGVFFNKLVNGKEVNFRQGDNAQAQRAIELGIEQGATIAEVNPIKRWVNWANKNA